MTAVVSPGRATRSTPLQHRLLGARVAELDAAQLQVAVPAQRRVTGLGRRHDAGVGVQHLLDALGADLGARHHHEHEGGHHHRHQDLHQVAEERGQRADLHAAAVDRGARRTRPRRRWRRSRPVMTIGNISAISRPAPQRHVGQLGVGACRTAPARSSSRTKARMTRMPVICSRSTRLTVSMRSCMARNSGRIRRTIRPTTMPEHRHDDQQQRRTAARPGRAPGRCRRRT